MVENPVDRFLLDRTNTVLMIIDIQEKLCKAMDAAELESLGANVNKLMAAAEELGIPVLTTEQYPAGLGETIPTIREKLTGQPMAKMTFSCCGDESISSCMDETGRGTVIVTGMEAHICVLQTALDLLRKGYFVHLVSDAVISRKKLDRQVGLDMAASAGAVITTTETILFQLLQKAGTDEFRKLSKLAR